MKRLYTFLLPLLLLSALLSPSLSAQSRSVDAPLARNEPEGTEQPVDTDRQMRQVLALGTRSAATTVSRINQERRLAAMTPEERAAAEAPAVALAVSSAPGRSMAMGVGFVATIPAAGASAIVNLSPNTAAQGLLGLFLGGARTVTGRYLYYFRETTNFQPFIFGEAGAWSYDQQTVLGFGGGAGLEYFIERYPFMSVTIEGTMREIGFDKDVYDVSGLAIGGGVHYYF